MMLNLVLKALLIVAIRLGSGSFSSLIIFFMKFIASWPFNVGVAWIGFAMFDGKCDQYINLSTRIPEKMRIIWNDNKPYP